MSKYENASLNVIKKPDYISIDDIADVLHDAHKVNSANGMHFSAAVNTGAELMEHVGEDGQFYVIMDGEKPCAVGAVKYRKWNKWFCKGELCGDIMLVGVKEQYKGMGLSRKLFQTIEEDAFKRCSILTMNTAERNTIMLNSRTRDNWIYVDSFSHEGTDFYSVMLAKWKDHCPYSKIYCNMMYQCRKALVRIMRKENGEYRYLIRMTKKNH